MKRVLIVDDEESICWGLQQLCKQMELGADTASSAEHGLELARAGKFDLVLMDVRLPGMDGISAIQEFRACSKAPIITMTAFGDLSTAVNAVKQGAFEYIVKPFELAEIKKKIEQALATSEFLDGATLPSPADREGLDAPVMVGSSALMQHVFKQIALTTTTNAPVLITGESGTGKELTARSIHQFSERSSGPFVAVNIAALSPTLAESELFGHVQGAFTGADSDRIGLIQQADGGTLFLDEVAEIPIELQVKLLRVLDQNEVTPVGSSEPIKTDFRLVSATHQDLLAQINHGEFRHDLFYRLRTFEVKLPPLRERTDDIPEIVEYFLRRQKGHDCIATPEFIDVLKSKPWNGNLRELQSAVERAATMARGGVISADHLSEDLDVQPAKSLTGLDDEIRFKVSEWIATQWNNGSISDLYSELISVIDPAVFTKAFELSGNQYSAAARRLGIHRTTLRKKLDEIKDADSTS